jgi:hypothetical protein
MSMTETAAALSVGGYNTAERAARLQAPISAVRAFTPLAFKLYGYPVEIEHECELVKMADGEHPLMRGSYATCRYSEPELAIVGAVRDAAARVTMRAVGRAMRPYYNFGGVIPCFRLIKRLFEVAEVPQSPGSRVVWEIGSGTAVLGAMLLRDGFALRGFDVTPIMYMWQSRLWTELVGAQAMDEQAALPLDRPADYPGEMACIHIPWWRHIRDFAPTAPRADLVVCEHALAELTPAALYHVLHTAARVVAGSRLGALVCTHIGASAQNQRGLVIDGLYKAGFALAWYSNVWVALHRSSPLFGETYLLQEVRSALSNNMMYVDEKRSGKARIAAADLSPAAAEGPTRTMAEVFPFGGDVADEILFGADINLYEPTGGSYPQHGWKSAAELG